MNNITICIPTYKRPEMLRDLILSIIGCNINKSLIRDVKIVVVDNDISMTAELTMNELNEKYNDTFGISYFSYPVKGLSNVRNELLKKAYLFNPDFVVFIDDDEHVTTEWLNELVKTIITNKGDMVMGPVISSFGNKSSRYISCWIERQNYLNNTRLNFIRTGNLIINVKSLLANNIWFDPRFNSTGGEDSYFGIQMMQKGATIFWASDAIAYETVPDNRANLKWLMKRYYNGANIFTYILKVEKAYTKLIKKVLTSLIYMIAGACATVITPFPMKRKYWGLLKLSEGMGGVAGLFSIKYYEYK